MARFNLKDGRWVELRPPSVNAILFIDEHLDDKGTFTLPKAKLPEMLVHLRRATLALSWSEGDIGELNSDQMGSIVGPWYESSEDDAVPPPDASTSAPTTPQPSSAAPTGRRGRSGPRSPSPTSTPAAL